MTNKMLIDASHPEETRVVVLRENQVEELDFESENKRPLRGNIYLAQITRVEPSLQAAFVEYGGNRQGFLAFNEIHPDYYQIPVSDREELVREHNEEERETTNIEATSAEKLGTQEGEAGETNENLTTVEDLGGDAHEEASISGRTRKLSRKYKIQEVIKRRQVILIQVVKEERGNKGAALTTYLSLAGRYCVLMPNTARGGGISRKINNASDRQKLKKIVATMDVSHGMGLIIRTAGSQKTATDIKRDYEYLIRMWENIRTFTMKSSAPSLVYEEGNLIKRSIRDLYNKDFDEVLIQGDEGYKDAKDYMKMLMPSHARKVKQHKGDTPIFHNNDIENQLSSMFSPVAQLPSGGYLVINQTEALVAVDVNSGRATKEHSIESTALKTNIEAAREVARQARLRDLAGLLVIDFIDMEENRNNRKVELKLKQALKDDRARIQVGKISPFGLLEMSRQRMRSGVVEGSSIACDHCGGTGMVRSVESRALYVLRWLEEEAIKQGTEQLIMVRLPADVTSYILNQKRINLNAIETNLNVRVMIEINHDLNAMQMVIDREHLGGQAVLVRMDGKTDTQDNEHDKKRRRHRRKSGKANENQAISPETHMDERAEETEETEETGPAKKHAQEADSDEEKPRRRRRGRRGGRHRKREQVSENTENQTENKTQSQSPAQSPMPAQIQGDGEAVPELDLSYLHKDADTAAEEKPAENKKPKRRAKKPNKKLESETAPETVGTTQAKDVGTTQAKDVGTTQAKDVGTTQAKDVGTTQAQGVGTTQAKDVGTTQAQGVGTTQAKDVGTTQAQGVGTTQAKDVGTTQAQGVGTTQAEVKEKPVKKKRKSRAKKPNTEPNVATGETKPRPKASADATTVTQLETAPPSDNASSQADDINKRKGWWNR